MDTEAIAYATSIDPVQPDALRGGFFERWGTPPTPEQHRALLGASTQVVLALHGRNVVGFINALSDGILAAYIPLLEVLPAYRGRGIGTQLVRRMLQALGPLYMVDVLCDPEVVPFYERLGLSPSSGVRIRNYAWGNRP
ncbi:MAG TPA: GNAT family N-acetyltransferase [Acidimicrobiales bacterium]|nr:GNAT family N-acetyltransferase [Acidimicrobiales bacterium]